MIAVVCFVSVSFGALSASAAKAGVLGWAMWPLVVLWLYRRRRRSFGLSDAQIQAVGRVGHLPLRGRPVLGVGPGRSGCGSAAPSECSLPSR